MKGPRTITAVVFLGDNGYAIERRFRSRRKALEFAKSVSLGGYWIDDGPLRVLLRWKGQQWDWWFIEGAVSRLPKQLWGYVS
jgi:hypothetical protein